MEVVITQKNMRALHYLIIFEPLHGDMGKLDLSGLLQRHVNKTEGGN